MLYYLILSAQKNNIEAIYKLGIYYKNMGDIPNMEKYLIMATERGYLDAAKILISQCKDEAQKAKYYELLAKNSVPDALCWLCIHYDNVMDFTNLFRFYNKIIEDRNLTVISMLANHYNKQCDDINMLKYATIGMKLGDASCMYLLCTYFERIGDRSNMLKYHRKNPGFSLPLPVC
jgi:hypothetical protein